MHYHVNTNMNSMMYMICFINMMSLVMNMVNMLVDDDMMLFSL